MSRTQWRVVVSGPAKRNLIGLPEKVATAIVETFGAIATNPHRVGKPLKLLHAGRWSTRRGPYRVIYVIDDDNRLVTIVAIGHRADVYRPR